MTTRELFKLHVPLAPRYAGELNRAAAIAELETLVSNVNAILHFSPVVAATVRDKGAVAIYKAAHRLRQELAEHGEGLLQEAGYIEGRASDTAGFSRRHVASFSRDLDDLIERTRRVPRRSKGGRPMEAGANRQRAVAEIAAYWRKWTRYKASPGDATRFNAFAAAIFETCGQPGKNLTRLIRNLQT